MHSEHILTISETSRNRCTLPAPFLLAQHLPRRPSQPHLTAQSNYHFFTIPHHSPHGPLHLYLICIRCLVNASRPRLASHHAASSKTSGSLLLASLSPTLRTIDASRCFGHITTHGQKPHHNSPASSPIHQPCYHALKKGLITYPSTMSPRFKKRRDSSPQQPSLITYPSTMSPRIKKEDSSPQQPQLITHSSPLSVPPIKPIPAKLCDDTNAPIHCRGKMEPDQYEPPTHA